MLVQLDWALRLNKSCPLAVTVHFLAVWFRLIGDHVLIPPHSGDPLVAYPCFPLLSLAEAKTKAHPHPPRLWIPRRQFGPPAQRGGTWAHLQQEEDPDEGCQDEGTAEHGHDGRQLSGRSFAEPRRFLAFSSVVCCCWVLPLWLRSVTLESPSKWGFTLDLVLVQAGGEDQATVRRAGQAVCRPGARAGEASRVAGQAGLDWGQVHPVLQGEVEELRPRGEARRTQLHATLEEEGEAGAALWMERGKWRQKKGNLMNPIKPIISKFLTTFTGKYSVQFRAAAHTFFSSWFFLSLSANLVCKRSQNSEKLILCLFSLWYISIITYCISLYIFIIITKLQSLPVHFSSVNRKL